MRVLKIIQCVVFFRPVRIGGIEIYVEALAKELIRRGHNVKVLVPSYPGELPYESNISGIPILTYSEIWNTTRMEFMGLAKSKRLPQFTEHMERERPDIVHFHQLTSSNGMTLLHMAAARRFGAKIVYTNHLAGLTCDTGTMMVNGKLACDGKVRTVKCIKCSLLTERNKPFGLHLQKSASSRGIAFLKNVYRCWQSIRARKAKAVKLLATCDKMIVVADWYHQVLKKNRLTGEKVSLVPQAVPWKPLPFEKIRRKSIGKLKAVFIGRIYPEKGLHILLEALKDVEQDKIELHIYGQIDGKDYYKFCKSIAKRKQNILWKKAILNEEVVSTLCNYDVLVIPSLIAEMAPLILQEAFYARIPVIGSRAGGVAEEIEHNVNGLLFTPGSVDELSACLNRVVKDGTLLDSFISNLRLPGTTKEMAAGIEQEYFAVLI